MQERDSVERHRAYPIESGGLDGDSEPRATEERDVLSVLEAKVAPRFRVDLAIDELGRDGDKAVLVHPRSEQLEYVDRVGRVLDHLDAGDEVEFPIRQNAPAIRLGELRSRIGIVAPGVDLMVPLKSDQHA